jgi:putative addiction module component (TIGR02574 family)
MSAPFQQFGLDKLSIADRLDLIDDLWDSIDDPIEPVEIPESHLNELKRRIADTDANPGAGITLAEWKARNAE